ncbi:hypothetical protein MOO46_00480 [Apilactobacillus apisilvae]|uniref:Uncharacterized protein n=1 Tax=Apilactobacillus apisilvae TaxID=2923364 RepID=A0ABY4PI22_9LACO|nr:hypothetical protein [Apilactobacillus apisilvae]UQS85116.1 hypothetical protein MOO46_00480 [Apilactobacillus apisilvae]
MTKRNFKKYILILTISLIIFVSFINTKNQRQVIKKVNPDNQTEFIWK